MPEQKAMIGSTPQLELGRIRIAEFAMLRLDRLAEVTHEPGVYIVHWGAKKLLPIPEYLVTGLRTAEIEEFFRRALRTLLPPVARAAVPEAEQCGKPLECGSTCCLRSAHLGECECGGDEPGKPGSCPA
jgi:hypothetical protein